MQLSVAARNARADQLTSQVGSAGKLRILTGSAPVDVATAQSGTLLAEFTMGTPFAPAASGGVLSPTMPAQVNALRIGSRRRAWRGSPAGGKVHPWKSCACSTSASCA